jgi:hypothetical protein
VVDKLPLSGRGSLLLIGWGEEAYRDAIAQRHPGLEFGVRNPFLGAQPPEEERTYGVVPLSGLLASCPGGQVEEMLKAAAFRLADGGILALHDTFLPACSLPPPEVVLGALGRRLGGSGCRDWSVGRLHDTLAALGFNSICSTPLPAGGTLVTASRTRPPAACAAGVRDGSICELGPRLSLRTSLSAAPGFSPGPSGRSWKGLRYARWPETI